MAADPRIRASDDDRDRTAALLREHHAVGRLTAEEFSERLDKAYAATTMGDLDELLADLPAIDLYRLPHASLPGYQAPSPHRPGPLPVPRPPAAAATGGRFSPAWAAAWGSWATVGAVTFVIYLASGAGYPWFLWIAGPYGLVLLARWISGSSHHG
jgi:Domain of unknown function (DUF1707)